MIVICLEISYPGVWTCQLTAGEEMTTVITQPHNSLPAVLLDIMRHFCSSEQDLFKLFTSLNNFFSVFIQIFQTLKYILCTPASVYSLFRVTGKCVGVVRVTEGNQGKDVQQFDYILPVMVSEQLTKRGNLFIIKMTNKYSNNFEGKQHLEKLGLNWAKH